MSYNTAVCFTGNEYFKSVAQSFCDHEDLTLEGCVDCVSNLIRYVKSLKPSNIIVDDWHNWHFIVEAFSKLFEEINVILLPQIYLIENQGFQSVVYRVESNIIQYLLTGHCGLCPKAGISSDEDYGEEEEKSTVRCFSCGASDKAQGDIIAFCTVPSVHSKNSDIVICNECIEKIWTAYQNILKGATSELLHGSGMKSKNRWSL